ncbi:hypothetical protein CVT24_012182, partial [Panaeolus cyanescens]
LHQDIRKSTGQVRYRISEARSQSKQLVVVSALVSCLSEHSRQNNIFKRIYGLYLYACGAQRQVVTILNHVGIAESYAGLTAKATNKTLEQKRKSGTLTQLSESMRKEARILGATAVFGQVYDNINFAEKVAEQTIGKTTTIENGTCATIWPLHNASLEDMKLKDFAKSFDAARPLKLEDIDHTTEEARLFKQCLQHCILRIIVTHGGEGFKKFESKLRETLPTTPQQISLHKTPLHPLPAMKIDESTIVGNAEVDEAIVEELQLKNNPTFMEHVRIIAGDQLSIDRLRSISRLRAGHVGGYAGFGWGVWMPGLFHGKMADMHGFFVTHWGKPQCGTRNPGSLNYHNTLLRHLPITVTSLPNFRTCRDLVFVSLYARVLHCLLQVSGYPSLSVYVKRVDSWDTLERHAQDILSKYANPSLCHELRQNRIDDEASGDMVFENAVLFLRDALISREFTDSIKSGDSGRVLLVLKLWAYAFRGSGRTKYAHEMLMLIHNIKNVWPPKITEIVLNNWLLNPTGKANSFVEVDLVQEHMNFWIKTFYKAHGTNSSWEWLAVISPCVDALRRLASTMKKVIGTDIGTRHAPPDLTRDIKVLMKSLDDHRVYSVVAGRRLDDDDPPVVDIISEGMAKTWGESVIADFNRGFVKLQERRRMRPVVGAANTSNSPHLTHPQHSPPSSNHSSPAPSLSRQSESLADPFEDDVGDAACGEDEDDLLRLHESSETEENEEETLTLSSLDDVALDMDNVEEVVDDMDNEDDLDDDETGLYSLSLDHLVSI